MGSRIHRTLLGCLLLSFLPLNAGGVRVASSEASWLRGGDSDGIALTDDGRLFLAPRLAALTDEPLQQAQQVFAMTADRGGHLFVATGTAGRIVRVTPSGVQSLFFQADEPLVTALATDPAGNLFAATAPGGTIYRIDPEGRADRFSETGERYVFSLVVAADGELYAGTGERGAVLAIGADGEPRLFFDSDEEHIAALAAGPDGTLLAGGSGRGGVYLIDADGNAVTLYQDRLSQIVAVALLPDGRVVAAAMEAPDRERRPAAVRLRLPASVNVETPTEGLAGVDEASASTIRGEIEGIATTAADEPEATIGRIVRISPEGASEELWRSTSEAPFCLLAADGGEVLFGTGDPARLYRIENDDRISHLATLVPSQTAQLLRVGRSIVVATSNPATLQRMESGETGPGVFVSPTIDAGAPSRWGSIGWRGGEGTELYTRTGNSRSPDATWSAWSPALLQRDGSAIVNPDGRYLQWRARMLGDSDPAAALSGISVSYEPYNRAPRMRNFRLDGRGDSRSATARWKLEVHDADGDSLTVRLVARRAGEADWTPIASEQSAGSPAADWREIELNVSLDPIAEGRWEVRPIVDDRQANPQGEGRRADSFATIALTVDRQPPRLELELETDGDRMTVRVRDDLSRVGRVELLRDGIVQHTLRATDGINDSGEESFRFSAPSPDGVWSIRGVDAAGNTKELALSPG